MKLSPQEEKKLIRLAKMVDSKEVATLEEFDALDSKVEELSNKMDENVLVTQDAIESISEELKKKLESELVLEIDREELKGDKGDKGDKGEKGDTTIVEKIIEKTEVIREQPIVTEIIKNVENPFILDGEVVVEKINLADTKIKAERVDGLVGKEEVATLQNRTQLLNQITSGIDRRVTALESDESTAEVNKIIAGAGISLSPTSGVGDVTVTNTGVLAETDTLQTVTDRGATTTTVSTFSTAIKTPKIYPSADSTTAVQVLKADGTTPVLNIDTTNKRVGVGTTAPFVALHSSDGATVANGIKAFWNDASDMMISANQPTYGSGLRIAVAHNTTVTSRPLVAFVRTRGTLETPASVQSNDNLGDLLFGGASSDGSIAYGGGLFAYADGATTVGSVPTRLSFVSGNHSGDRKERLTIKANGEIRIAQPNPVLYYLIDGSTTPARSVIYGASSGSIYNTMNAYFDGSNWQRDDATKAAVFFSLDAGSATVLSRFRYAAAGANPFTPLTAFQVSVTCVLQVPKLSPISDCTTAMQFFQANGTTAVMTIDTTNGRVGIGTTAPTYKLDVTQSTNAIMGVRVSNSNAGTAAQSRFFADNGASSTSFGHTGTGYSTYGALTANSGYMYSSGAVALVLMADSADGILKFATGGSTERMRIDKGGKVGIGTTAPSGRLHVVDSAFAGTLLMERNGQTSDSAFSAMRLMTTKTTNMNDGFGSLIAFLIKDDSGGENNVGFIGAVRAGADNTGDLVFAPAIASAYTERMRLTSAGNLGIGTTAPSAKLHSLATTEQLRLGYDASNYLSATVGSTGSTTFALTGTTPIFTFSQAVKFSGGTQSSDGSAGATGSFTTADSKTVTVKNGLITSIV
jgi:hypothetical protein